MRVRRMIRMPPVLALLCLLPASAGAERVRLPGFRIGALLGEQWREEVFETGARVVINAPSASAFDDAKPTRILFYATPNGNSIEQTLGCRTSDGIDWHFDIQHVAAQTRVLRELVTDENLVLVCLDTEERSWPAWRRKHSGANRRIRRIVDAVRRMLPGKDPRVWLTGHSGGGSFLWGFLEAEETIPEWVDRIAFLDSNYSFSTDKRHGAKLLAWLRGDGTRRLIVIAYDDREITLNGKRVVGPTGGTYRASHRMIDRFAKDDPLTKSTNGPFDVWSGLDERICIEIHRNLKNKILHTALVGEMNGVLHAMTFGSSNEKAWGVWGGPRAYERHLEPADPKRLIPRRRSSALGGTAFMEKIADLPREDREAAIVKEFLAGNVPSFLRRFKSVRVKGQGADCATHQAVFDVMPDYLAIGSDKDFVRVPMNPMSAQRIASAFACSLPTRKLVDEIDKHADVLLAPRPLTEQREAVTTFLQHHGIIERQRAGKRLGLLVAGIKKDVVISNRLLERPDRVAIYGWRKPDGKPIQNLTIVHVDWYVDYSHGARLVKQRLLVDGQSTTLAELLRDPDRCFLVSDEGTIERPVYP